MQEVQKVKQYQLNYASLSDDENEDIPEYYFDSVIDISKWLIDMSLTKQFNDRVYLLTFFDMVNRKDLLFVTDYYDTIIDIIRNTHTSFDVAFSEIIHIHEYESFEAAYEVALTMKEPHPLCYDKPNSNN